MICVRIQAFNVGILSTNCYVAVCPETHDAIIIDPGFDAPSEAEHILRYVDEWTLKVKFIVNTHGHADHVSGDSLLKKKTAVILFIAAIILALIWLPIVSYGLNTTVNPIPSILGFGGLIVAMGVFMVIILPIIGFIAGFIQGLIYAALYNFLAPRIGGVKVRFEETRATT